jgi:hypothetical protein
MKVMFRMFLLAGLLLAWGTFVFAQTGTPSRPNAAAVRRSSFGCTMTIGPIAAGVSGPTRPYSAVEEAIHTQTLSDGTQLTEKHLMQKFYRDSQGRERTEHPFCQGPDESLGSSMVVEIHDPMMGYAYVLEPEGHIAHRFKSDPIVRVAPNPQRDAVKVATNLVPTTASVKHDNEPPEIVTESLGSKMIEGVYAEGTRTTRTIPAGREGNDRPINIVQESWVSKELEVSILNKYIDPRSGESTTRLTNIDLSEPSIDLFQLPPEYKIVDETEPVTIYHRP